MRPVAIVALVLSTVTTARVEAQKPDTVAEAKWIRTVSGLEYLVVTEGRGRAVGRGDTVTIHEALSLPDGRTVFDSRAAPNKPVTFTLGANQVIRGVVVGVTGLRVGERRRLRVPPALDGRTFDPAFIPPTATRLYDVEVLATKP